METGVCESECEWEIVLLVPFTFGLQYTNRFLMVFRLKGIFILLYVWRTQTLTYLRTYQELQFFNTFSLVSVISLLLSMYFDQVSHTASGYMSLFKLKYLPQFAPLDTNSCIFTADSLSIDLV